MNLPVPPDLSFISSSPALYKWHSIAAELKGIINLVMILGP